MTLGEAQLRLENRLDTNEGEIGKQDCDAIKLGIEALKRIKAGRGGYTKEIVSALLGETEE